MHHTSARLRWPQSKLAQRRYASLTQIFDMFGAPCDPRSRFYQEGRQ